MKISFHTLSSGFLLSRAAFAAVQKEDIASGVSFSVPFDVMNMQQENSTELFCTTVNFQELCSRIEFCPQEALSCDVSEPFPTDGYFPSCAFTPPLCSCLATWGGLPCRCELDTLGGYLVTLNVECPDGDFAIEGGGHYFYDCAEPNCFRTAKFRTVAKGYLKDLDLDWRCPDDITDSLNYDQCSCSARYNSEDCSWCKVCHINDAGSFSVECPGVSMDCENNFVIWDYQRDTSFSCPLFKTVEVVMVVAGIWIATFFQMI